MFDQIHAPCVSLSLLNCPKNSDSLPGPAAQQSHQVAPCNTQSCDVCIDGAWGAWNDWSKCTATCDVGFRVRHRDVMQRPNSCGKPALGHWAFFLWGETGMVGDTWGSHSKHHGDGDSGGGGGGDGDGDGDDDDDDDDDDEDETMQ